MPQLFRGERRTSPGRWAVVVSRYNESVTTRLLEGALQTFLSAGTPDTAIDVAWVPGAWELPLVAQRFAASRRYLAVICLGAVIRGETTHDQHINRAVSGSISRIACRYDLPVLFGLLTCDSLEQAIQRAGGEVGNKGTECAKAALEMVDLLQKLPHPGRQEKN